VGIGLVTSVAPAMMIALYPEEKRAYAVGLFTLFFALGGLLGPIIGGILINLFDWRAVFWFRIPISLLSLILIVFMPNKRIEPKQTNFDWIGAISLVFFLVVCLLTINQLHSIERRGFWPVLIYASVAMISIYIFVRQERRADDPILELTIFKNINFVVINLASCLLYSVTFSVILIVPFFLYKTATISTNEAGFILSVGFIGASIAGLISGKLIGALQSNYMSFFGILITGIGLSLIGYADPSTGLFWMISAIFLQGVGTGLFQSSYLFIITGLLPASQRGVSGSIVMLTRTIGVVSGVSMLTLGFAWLNKVNQVTGLNPDEVFNKSFQQIFVLAGGVLLLFLLATLAKPTIWFGKNSK
jgi:MFS family permease